MILDPTINVGNLLTGLVMLGAFALWAFRAGADFQVLRAKVDEISKKLDSFISKDMLDEKQKRSDDIHKSLQRQIDELRTGIG